MRDAVSQPSLNIEESYFSKNILFFCKKWFLSLLHEALNPLNPSNSRIWDLFCSSILFSQKERKEKNGSSGINGLCLLCCSSHLNDNWHCGKIVHKSGQIHQNCAINCGIQGNASNKNTTKSKNLFVVKSMNNIQRFVRYRILALIWIGRLCNKTYNNYRSPPLSQLGMVS